MSLGTLSFEIEADDSGAEDAMDALDERLSAIEDQLGEVGDAAQEAGDHLADIGKKTSSAFNMQAVKMFAKAVKEVAGFIYDSAKAAADAGSGPMKKFVGDIDLLKQSFVKVGAQAASQLLPALDGLTKSFLTSKDAASALKDAGNFIANVFRVLATVGAVVIATFDAVGKSIGAAASMIVDVLAGNFQNASDTMAETGKDMGKILDRLQKQIETIWKPGGDFKGSVDVKGSQKQQSKDMAGSAFNQSVKAIQAEVAQRKALYDAIGDTTKQFEVLTSGTSSFDDALKQYEKAAVSAADFTKQAAIDTADGFTYAANAAKVQADNASRDMEKFSAAADAWAKKAEENVDTIGGAMSAFAGAITKAIPRLGELMQAAEQGAQAGGVWGALIAVFVQLASETEGFSRIVDLVNSNLDGLIAALNPLISAFADLMQAFNPVTNLITGLVGGAIKPLAGLLDALAPILKAIVEPLSSVSDGMNQFGLLMDTLKPVFEILKIIGVVLKVLGPILQLIMIPLKLVGDLFQGLFDMLDPVFKEIDKAMSWLSNRLDEFGDWVSHLGEMIENFIKGKGFKTNAELAAQQNSTPESRAENDAGGAGHEGLVSPMDDNADAVDHNTKAQNDMTKATLNATAALLNVPEGYKVAVQRFAQQQAIGEMTITSIIPLIASLLTVPHMAAGGVVDKPTLALIGESGPEAVVPLSGGRGDAGSIYIDSVTIVAQDPKSFVRQLRRMAFTRTGAAFQGA